MGIQLANREAERAFKSDPIPTESKLCELHKLVFDDVYKVSGKLKETSNYLTGVIWSPAPPWRVASELMRLNKHTEQLQAKADTRELYAQAIAFHGSQLWRIQPFDDGNSRIVDIVARAQTQAFLQRRPPTYDHSLRKLGLVEANEPDSQLTTLGRSLTGVSVPFELRTVSYKRDCDQCPGVVYRRLSNEMPCGLSIETRTQAKQFMSAPIDARFLQEATRLGRANGIPIDKKALFESQSPCLTVDEQELARQRKRGPTHDP